jgi:hypothetical protein
MKHYFPTGRRNYGSLLKRLLDTWDQNGSTVGPTPWQIYDDDKILVYYSHWKPKTACHIDILFKSLKKAQFMVKCLIVNKWPAVRMFYHAYFLSPVKYDIIFWLTDSTVKCCLQKKVIHLIFGTKGSASCRNSCKAHEVLTIASTCILVVWCFYKKVSHEC